MRSHRLHHHRLGAYGVAAEGPVQRLWKDRRAREDLGWLLGCPCGHTSGPTTRVPTPTDMGCARTLSNGGLTLQAQGGGGFLKDRLMPARNGDRRVGIGRDQTAPLPSSRRPTRDREAGRAQREPKLYWLKVLLRSLVGWDWTFQGGHSPGLS